MITITGLHKTYGKRTAVDDLSFNVASGRVTGFVGPNGAGKSTSMRMMVGLTRPDAGHVAYDGVEYTDLRRPAQVVGSMLNAHSMHPGRTARQHLRATAALSRLSMSRVNAVLGEVGLVSAADQRAGGFSLGMRQRLALAVALLGEPEVLLLDEPSTGLDPDGIRWLRTYLTGFAQQGGTVFVSSHLIGELALFAEDLVVVGAGKLLAAESVASMSTRNAKVVLVETVDAEHVTALAGHLTATGLDVHIDGAQLRVKGSDRRTVAQVAHRHGIPVLELTETSRSLEDTLLDLTASSAEFASG
jgi:ABC-2 type transport system ATP-binding protein